MGDFNVVLPTGAVPQGGGWRCFSNNCVGVQYIGDTMGDSVVFWLKAICHAMTIAVQLSFIAALIAVLMPASTGTAHSFNEKLAHHGITPVDVGQLQNAIGLWRRIISDRIAGDGHTVPEIGDALLGLSRPLWQYCVLTAVPRQPDCLFDLLTVVLSRTAVKPRVWPFLEADINKAWLVKRLVDGGDGPPAPAPVAPTAAATAAPDGGGSASEAEDEDTGDDDDVPTDDEVAAALGTAAPHPAVQFAASSDPGLAADAAAEAGAIADAEDDALEAWSSHWLWVQVRARADDFLTSVPTLFLEILALILGVAAGQDSVSRSAFVMLCATTWRFAVRVGSAAAALMAVTMTAISGTAYYYAWPLLGGAFLSVGLGAGLRYLSSAPWASEAERLSAGIQSVAEAVLPPQPGAPRASAAAPRASVRQAAPKPRPILKKPEVAPTAGGHNHAPSAIPTSGWLAGFPGAGAASLFGMPPAPAVSAAAGTTPGIVSGIGAVLRPDALPPPLFLRRQCRPWARRPEELADTMAGGRAALGAGPAVERGVRPAPVGAQGWAALAAGSPSVAAPPACPVQPCGQVARRVVGPQVVAPPADQAGAAGPEPPEDWRGAYLAEAHQVAVAPRVQAVVVAPLAARPVSPQAEEPAARPARPVVAAAVALTAAPPAFPQAEEPAAHPARPVAAAAGVPRGQTPSAPDVGRAPSSTAENAWGLRSIGACEPMGAPIVVNGSLCITPVRKASRAGATSGSAGSRRI